MNPSGNYGWGLPVAASTYAHRIDWSLNLLHAVMFLIFFLWGVYLVWCLIRYRRKEGVAAIYSHHTPLSSYIPDGAMLAFEIWLIFMIGIPIWAHIREDLPKPDKALRVRLVAEQYSWLFHYPGHDGKFGKQNAALMHANNPLGLDENDSDSRDDILSVNELYSPLGQPVLLEMSSKDVVHSFFVPEFRTKQDVVPGMKIPMWFEPTALGKFEIGCAQLCGTGHYRMRGDVIVQNPQEFEDWIQKQSGLKKGS